MSLDFYLEKQQTCPACGHQFGGDDFEPIHSQNITHNLGAMAMEGDIYNCLWHPEDHGFKTAAQIIEPLEKAISAMRSDPDRFKAHDSPNGWGLYINFLPWLERLLEACRENPGAGIRASR